MQFPSVLRSFFAIQLGCAFWTIAFSYQALASTWPYCHDDTIKSIKVPLDSTVKTSPQFSYSFQVLPGLNLNAPMIIFIPGGPGDTSITAPSEERRLALLRYGFPDGFPLVLTDPRGVGCNHLDEKFPVGSLTSFELASDVLAMIRFLKPNSYILYGFSYGTELATIIASRAEAGEALAPSAIVLAGVIGKATSEPNQSIADYLSKEWDIFFQSLPIEVSSRIVTKANEIGPEFIPWDSLIVGGLYKGTHIINGKLGNPLYDGLMHITDTDTVLFHKFIEGFKNQSVPRLGSGLVGDFNEQKDLDRYIACHEISSSNPFTSFENGHIIARRDLDNCLGERLDRPYDSSQWPIRAPIVYLSGEHDPATPYEGAKFHFSHQEKSKRRLFITAPAGAHNLIGEQLANCRNEIWESIFQNGVAFSQMLNRCNPSLLLDVL